MKVIITVKDTDNIIGLKEDIAMRLEGLDGLSAFCVLYEKEYADFQTQNEELKKQIMFYSNEIKFQDEQIEGLRKELLERSKND
jgi:hypothetical protein